MFQMLMMAYGPEVLLDECRRSTSNIPHDKFSFETMIRSIIK